MMTAVAAIQRCAHIGGVEQTRDVLALAKAACQGAGLVGWDGETEEMLSFTKSFDHWRQSPQNRRKFSNSIYDNDRT